MSEMGIIFWITVMIIVLRRYMIIWKAVKYLFSLVTKIRKESEEQIDKKKKRKQNLVNEVFRARNKLASDPLEARKELELIAIEYSKDEVNEVFREIEKWHSNG